ncbi:hypothetical protein DIPPA_05265 [Diplonema papillatum]|nr:hypothetical protein DIPPA_05265 [Diplonema papillatum]
MLRCLRRPPQPRDALRERSCSDVSVRLRPGEDVLPPGLSPPSAAPPTLASVHSTHPELLDATRSCGVASKAFTTPKKDG